MKRILTATFLFAAITLVSCTSDNKTENTEATETATTGEPTTTAATDTTPTENKKELMQTLAQFGMLQVEMGKLAAEKGTSDEVKQSGRQMSQLYATHQTELQEIANTYNVELTTGLDEEHRKHVDELRQQKAQEFDKKYLETLTDVQKETLGKYDDVLKDITEADATGFGIWARTTEKELRAQHEQALAQLHELNNRQ